MRLRFRRGKLLRSTGKETDPLLRNPLFSRERRPFSDSWASSAVLAGIALIVGGIGFLLSDPTFHIDRIDVNGASRLPSAELERTTREAMTGRVLVFRKDTYWLADTKRAAETLTARWGLASASVEKRWPNRLVVTVTEKQPRFRFEAADAIYLIDENGRVAGTAVEGQLLEEFILLTFSDLGPFDPSQPLFSTERGSFLVTVVDRLRQANHVVKGIELLPEVERTVRFETSEGWTLIVNPALSALEQTESALKVYDTIPEAERKQIEYIDARIPGRVIYR